MVDKMLGKCFVVWKKSCNFVPLFTHRRVMGNYSPVKQAKILSNTFLKTKEKNEHI